MPSPGEDQQLPAPQNGNGHHRFDEDVRTTSSTAVGEHLTEADLQGGDDVGGDENDRKQGRHRPRKRKLYGDICKQMEFYFSDANVTKNRMMHEIVDQANSQAEGYVDLSTFLDFTKIQRLTTSISHIQKALATSEKLELSPDRLKARRKVPFDASKVKTETAVEECTIYVENIPRDSDHEWLEKIFQAFGPVAYISLPKFKSGHHKGFAFVEFDDLDAARRCLEAYGEEGACLPSDIDPAQLRSIQSFQEEHIKGKTTPSNKTPEQDSSKSNLIESSSEVKSANGKQKRKAEEALPNDDAPKKKKSKDTSKSATPVLSSSGSEEESEMPHAKEETTTTSKNKHKKRRKNKPKKSVEAKLESESIMLKVLPKKGWRQLRNRYLNLQRNNMSKLKKQLQQQIVRADHYKNFYNPPARSQKHHHHIEEPEVDTSDHFSDQRLQDYIMEVKMNEPAESVESFRQRISVELAEQDEDEAAISGFIKFVDYQDKGLQAFVRVNGDESFASRGSSLLKKVQEAFSSARFLSGKEAEEYKRNVQAALKQKHKEQPRRNVRGKDRLMKAATKSSHIRFDSSDDDEEATKNNETEETEIKNKIPA